MRIAASAPGKFVLSGEYAVLDGAPAICVAVDRRASVVIEPHEGDHHVVRAPGFTADVGRFVTAAGALTWLDGGRDFGLFEAAWNAARPVRVEDRLGISLDTASFREPKTGRKIGLGSSAALAAALATALESLGGASAASVAHAAHRRFQGGAGSGVDIACSMAGGAIEYRMAKKQWQPVQWPQGLHFSVLWSGVAAGTGARLARYADQPDGDRRRTLGRASATVAAALGNADAASVLTSLGEYTQALLRFDEAHGLGIFEAGHASLVERAAGTGVVYKPCGAGGGDVGVALATDRASLASFEAAAAGAGFARLALQIDPRGAMLHDEDLL